MRDDKNFQGQSLRLRVSYFTFLLGVVHILHLQGPPYVFATFLVIKTTKAGENIWRTL